MLFFHELLIIQFCLYQLVLQYRQNVFLRCHRYGSFYAKCLLCFICAPPCTTWCCLHCEERRAGHLLVVTLLYQGSGWWQGSADYHWESWESLEDKQLAHGESMALFGGWWHQFTTKWETLSCLEERAEEAAFVKRKEALARGWWNLWTRSESLSQVIRCWKQTVIACWAVCVPTWCYTDVSCHLTEGQTCIISSYFESRLTWLYLFWFLLFSWMLQN